VKRAALLLVVAAACQRAAPAPPDFAGWVAAGDRAAERDDDLSTRAALASYGRALDRCRRSGDLRGRTRVLAKMAALEERLGATARQRAVADEALVVARAAGDEDAVTEAMSQLGGALINQGETDRAEAILGDAVARAHAAARPVLEAEALVNLGGAYLSRDRSQEAIAPLERAVLLLADGGDRSVLASAHNDLGGVYRRLGDGPRALEEYGAAVKLQRARGSIDGAAGAILDIGFTYYEVLEQPEPAIASFVDARAGFVRAGDRTGEAWALTGLGSAYLQLEQPAAALPYLEAALGRWRELGAPRGEGGTLRNIGFAQIMLGLPERALDTFATARKFAERIGNKDYESVTLQGTARAERLLGRLAEARAHLEEALAIMESSRASVSGAELRASTFVFSRKSYEAYVEILTRLGDVETAFRASEQARARSLLDAVGGADAEAPAPPAALSAAAARALLDDDTVVVEYLLAEPRSFAWVLDRAGLYEHELAGRKAIEERCRRAVDLLGARNLRPAGESTDARATRLAAADAALPAALGAVADAVLAPLAGELAKRRLVVVADGALQYVPFAALPLGGATLVTQHEVLSIPSLSVLAAARATPRPARGDRIALLGDPVFQARDERVRGRSGAAAAPAELAALTRSAAESGLDELSRLYHSRAEVEAIAALVPPPKAFVALDFAASRATALGPDVAAARIVHFATHGLVNSRHPALSGLVLSLVDENGASVAGFLRLADIYRMKLRAELVVLSGCQTALGREVRGEGLMGLTRGFMVAGVPRVVASLWAVNDEATAKLMTRMYGALLTDGLTPAAALRAAQLALLGDPRFGAPYYWAAFSFQGDWR